MPTTDEAQVAYDGRNTNDALTFIKESENQDNNPTVQGPDHSDPELQQQEGESQAEYNERIPVGLQPVQPAPTKSYLGEDL